ncbi:hypothetical protein HJC23_013351 [Cyclotella cryptica]|uniref:Uncharacterized protein n=1 Tax=Cyclotella cryptica TaxID=29204 RepID=A0ABD3P848_9STRA
MKTFIALFLSVSTDAHVVGKASKGDSMSYSFSEFESKSAKSGIRYLIHVDEIESRVLHNAEMSYRMFVPRPKAFKSDSTKSVSAKALKTHSTKGGKSLKSVESDMSFPFLSAKSTKDIFPSAESSKSDESAKSKALKNAPIGGKSFKSVEKITTQDLVNSADGSKSSKSAVLFHRFLDFDISMSYPIIVAGKSVKLDTKKMTSSKAEKEMAKLSTEQSSKAAKLSSVRSVDPSNEPILQYASAIDFTRTSDPTVASATVEETSSSVMIRQGLLTMCVALMALYPLC